MKMETFRLIKVIKSARHTLQKVMREGNFDVTYDFLLIIPKTSCSEEHIIINSINLLTEQFEKVKEKNAKKGRAAIFENEKFLIITDDDMLSLECAKNLCSRISFVRYISMEEMNDLCIRFSFLPLNNHIILADLHKIPGRNYEGIIDKRGVSIEELIAISILGVKRKNYIQGLQKNA